ncbi:MAG: DUF2336 domain-containing protein [Sphingomicrobium sp.]
MMPEEWPIAALPAERGAMTRRPGRGRLDTVRRDLFLDENERLTEQERALMKAMLACIVAEIADDIRASLPDGWGAANDPDNDVLLARLRRARLLDIEPLVALLLRRAEEESALAAAQARPHRREARLLNSLVSHDNGPVAAAAMSLVLARGKRRDPLGQCLIAADDLDPATLVQLAQSVAAAMRAGVADRYGVAAADEALGEAVDRLVRRQTREASSDALMLELVALLDSAGRLDDAFLIAAAGEGEIALLAHGLARRAGVEPAIAADSLVSGDPAQIMALLRMGGASRELAANLIAGSGDLLTLADSGQAIEQFDQMPAATVDVARAWMRSADGYRAALARLERDDG